MELYPRENYLNKIRGFYHDTELIKVITGVRRCGKSSLMHTIAEELQSSGIDKEKLIFINLDARGYKSRKTNEQLEQLLSRYDDIKGTKYLFIDEIQNVTGFEEVINAFREDGNYSIFITGSNSYLLSGELITKLTGRYIEFEMRTLSFEEYLGMKRFYGKPVSVNLTDELDVYIRNGGFPKTVFYDNEADKRIYIESIIQEIFEKDIKRRVKIKNVSTFEKVQTYLINNYGSTTSLTNMLQELKKNGMDIKRETLNRYIGILKDAKII